MCPAAVLLIYCTALAVQYSWFSLGGACDVVSYDARYIPRSRLCQLPAEKPPMMGGYKVEPRVRQYWTTRQDKSTYSSNWPTSLALHGIVFCQ